jgi:hypothetical protein
VHSNTAVAGVSNDDSGLKMPTRLPLIDIFEKLPGRILAAETLAGLNVVEADTIHKAVSGLIQGPTSFLILKRPLLMTL